MKLSMGFFKKIKNQHNTQWIIVIFVQIILDKI